MSTSKSDKLSMRNLTGYSLGAMPAGLFSAIFMLKYVEFFFDELALLPIYFIMGQIIYMVVNAINDPLLGQLSDRTDSSKWGSRRLIFIKFGAPIWAFSFLLVWFPWSIDNQFIIFIHFVISICLFDTFLTLVILVWMSLLPEMTTDIDERNKATFMVQIVGLFSVLPFFVIVGEMNPNSETFRMLMIVIAVISMIALWIVTYLCEERPELQLGEPFPLFKSVKEVMKSKSFLVFVFYNFCSVFMRSIGLSYLFVYLLIMGDNGLLIYMGVYIFVGYSSNVLCMRLRPKWGMRRIIYRFGVLRVIGILIVFPIVLLTDDVLPVIIGYIISTFFAGYEVFTIPILHLSMDEDEVKHGIRREGIFFGMNALFTKPADSFGPITATIILTAFGYSALLDIQPASAFFGIRILFLLVPAVITAISLIFMYMYPLHGEKQEKMREKLHALHDEKRTHVSQI
ncbi:MAG: MFS transporter [Candidatus Hodarchaeales archaeon]